MTIGHLEQMLASLEAYELYRWGQDLFERRDYISAAKVLRHLVDTHPDERDLGAARELLARSYFHSAQLERTVRTSREILAREPTNAYVVLLLTRALERSGRHDEAASARRVADSLRAS